MIWLIIQIGSVISIRRMVGLGSPTRKNIYFWQPKIIYNMRICHIFDNNVASRMHKLKEYL